MLKITNPAPTGSHVASIEDNDQGGFTIKGNGFRVVEVTFGGGEFHVSLPGSVPDSNTCGFHGDGTGHVEVTPE